MNRSKTWTIMLLAPGLFTCEPVEEEFDFSLVAGNYTGSISYFKADQRNEMDIQALPELSKASGYKVTISESGPEYTLAFDKDFKYEVKDITVKVNPYYDNTPTIVSIQTVDNQPYSTVIKQTFPHQPNSFFHIEETLRRFDCVILLKSTDPDSVYFLNIQVQRGY